MFFTGRGDAAKRLLEDTVNGLALDQRPAELLIILSDVYFELGETRNAEHALRECLSRHPNNADAHFNLSLVLNRQGRRDEAAQARSAALRVKSHADEVTGPMSDLTLPATAEELKEFERRKAEKSRAELRAELRADWRSNPPLLKLAWVVAIVGLLCFFLFLAASFLSTVSRTGF